MAKGGRPDPGAQGGCGAGPDSIRMTILIILGTRMIILVLRMIRMIILMLRMVILMGPAPLWAPGSGPPPLAMSHEP